MSKKHSSRLTPIGPGTRSGRLLYRCSCGVEKELVPCNVKSGNTRSCGCLKREEAKRNATKHGWCGTRTYRCWKDMIQRATNPNRPGCKDYSGRGIRVCDRWRGSFVLFLEDMGKCPDGIELDRFPDKNGNYEPSNCRWATDHQQTRNMRRNRLITFRGKTQCVTDWADEVGLSVTCIRLRLNKGWDVERALTTPSKGKPRCGTMT